MHLPLPQRWQSWPLQWCWDCPVSSLWRGWREHGYLLLPDTQTSCNRRNVTVWIYIIVQVVTGCLFLSFKSKNLEEDDPSQVVVFASFFWSRSSSASKTLNRKGSWPRRSVADPDSNPDPSDQYDFRLPGSGSGSISQRYRSRSRYFYHEAKVVRKTLIPSVLRLLFWEMYLQKVTSRKTDENRFGSGSISQSHVSVDPDPDPHQNVMDPQHCFSGGGCYSTCLVCLRSRSPSRTVTWRGSWLPR